MPGWSRGELGCLKPPLQLGLRIDRDQGSHPRHTPKQRLPPLCSFLSVSKSLLGGCQEEPGSVLAEIFIREAVVLPRGRCMLRAPEQHFAPSKPPNCPNTARHAWTT